MFVLLLAKENDRTSFSKYYVPNVHIKDFNVLIDGKGFFDIPIKNGEETYKQIIEMGKKWLHDRQFIGLWVLFKTFQINCNRLKHINWIIKCCLKATN